MPGATLKHSRPTSSAWPDSAPSAFGKFVLQPDPQTQVIWHASGLTTSGFACQPGSEASTWASGTPVPVRVGSKCRTAVMPITSASAKPRDAYAPIAQAKRKRIGLLDQRAYNPVARDRPVVAAVLAFGTIVTEDEIFARAQPVGLVAVRRHGLRARFEVRF